MSSFSLLQPRVSLIDFPFLFPALFGSGADGDVTTAGGGSGNVADAGYLGTYGLKNFTNFTLAAGDTFTLPPGSSNGAMIISAQGTMTIAGTITGNGAAGSNAASGHSGAGGATAGGGNGGAQVTASAVGNNGADATKRGHGACSSWNIASNGNQARGGPSGAHTTAVANLAGQVGYECNAAQVGGYFYSKQGVHVGPTPSQTNGTASSSGTVQTIPPYGNYGPNADANFPYLSLDYLPPGTCFGSGGVTPAGSSIDSGGGGSGGGGGVLYIEADTIVLTAGYAINLIGGNGGNGYSGNGTTAKGAGGCGAGGGTIVLVCRVLIGSLAAMSVAGGSLGTGAGTSAANGLNGPAGGIFVIKI